LFVVILVKAEIIPVFRQMHYFDITIWKNREFFNEIIEGASRGMQRCPVLRQGKERGYMISAQISGSLVVF